MLIVEDGTGVSGANTYVSVAVCKNYLSMIGATIPSDQEITAMLLNSCSYIDSFSPKYTGEKQHDVNMLSFPRIGCLLDGAMPIPESIIPSILVDCQLNLVEHVISGGSLTTSANEVKFVTGERVEGAIDIKYAEPSSMITGVNINGVSIPLVDNKLARLFKRIGLNVPNVRT